MCINFGPELQGGGWAGGRERRVGVEVGREVAKAGGGEGGGKSCRVKTRGHQLLPDGPDH